MPSKVEICNLALLRLGQRPILALTEPSVEANYCSQLYDQARRETLRHHAWRFALKTETLAAEEFEADGDWIFSYALPSDCVRALQVKTAGVPTLMDFEVHGHSLRTNADGAVLRYVRDEQDPTRFDDLFVQALSYKLAADLAVPITGDSGAMAGLLQMFTVSIRSAMAASSSEARRRQNHEETLAESRQ